MRARLSSLALLGLLVLPPSGHAAPGQIDVPILGPNGPSREHIGVVSWNAAKNQNVVRQQYDFSCGSASLTTLLQEYIGLSVTETDAMNGMLRYGKPRKSSSDAAFHCWT